MFKDFEDCHLAILKGRIKQIIDYHPGMSYVRMIRRRHIHGAILPSTCWLPSSDFDNAFVGSCKLRHALHRHVLYCTSVEGRQKIDVQLLR